MNTLHEDLDSSSGAHSRIRIDVACWICCATNPGRPESWRKRWAENRFVVMQHLALLRAARLVTVLADGRRRINFLNPIPIQHIYERWVGKYQGDWASALVGLKHTVEGQSESRTTNKTLTTNKRRRSSG